MKKKNLFCFFISFCFLVIQTKVAAQCVPQFYITNTNANTVSIVKSGVEIAEIGVGQAPYGVSATQDGSKVYISNVNSSSISVINTITNTVTATISLAYVPYGICITPDGSKLYVANINNDKVTVINTATNTVSATINVGSDPWGITVNPDGSKVYVANSGSNTVSVINTATDAVTATITVADGPVGIAFSPDGTRAYVACSNSIIGNYTNRVSVINTAMELTLTSIIVTQGPQAICAGTDGSRVYVACGTGLDVINTATNTVVTTVTSNMSQPRGVSIHPDGTKLYAVSGSVLRVMNTATNTVTNGTALGWGSVGFGNFISNPCGNPLPLSITGFRANLQKSGNVLLTWQTANEVSTNRYEIQRSPDGRHFSSIGTIAPENKHDPLTDYRYNDYPDHNVSLVYYRIKQIAGDGEINYTPIQSVNLHSNDAAGKVMIIYPNPAKDHITIQGDGLKHLAIVNEIGRVLIKRSISDKETMVNISMLEHGIYTVLVSDNQNVKTARKLVIK